MWSLFAVVFSFTYSEMGLMDWNRQGSIWILEKNQEEEEKEGKEKKGKRGTGNGGGEERKRRLKKWSSGDVTRQQEIFWEDQITNGQRSLEKDKLWDGPLCCLDGFPWNHTPTLCCSLRKWFLLRVDTANSGDLSLRDMSYLNFSSLVSWCACSNHANSRPHSCTSEINPLPLPPLSLKWCLSKSAHCWNFDFALVPLVSLLHYCSQHFFR